MIKTLQHLFMYLVQKDYGRLGGSGKYYKDF